MNFLSSGVFWGLVIVVFGLSLILREVFHIQFPILRVLFGLLLIYWGIRVIADGFNRRQSHQAVFSNNSTTYDDLQREYNVVFGNSTIDFFKANEPTEDKKCEVNSVFSNTVIVINESLPIKVEMDAVFGSIAAPGKNVAGFGESIYTTPAYNPDKPSIKIKADAVFGRISIEPRKW